MNQLLTAPQVTMSEVPVRLEQLDARLKAIVRLKLREFIHLTPVFQNIASIDSQPCPMRQVAVPMRIDGEIFFDLASIAPVAVESDCPNRPLRIAQRRRINRAVGV